MIVVQPKEPRHYAKASVYYSRYSVKNNVCNLIINNDSYENSISTALVYYLKLDGATPSSIHHWVDKKGPCIKVMNFFQVPISIGKFSQDLVTCDVVDMDACHILLG